MKLNEWLDEYRSLPADPVARPTGREDEDWAEEDLFASAARVRDTTPRWKERAERVGYARVTRL